MKTAASALSTARGLVLVVDDDTNAREALIALVALQGFTVLGASSLKEARIQLLRQQPDVILIDLKLPDGNGMELVGDLECLDATQVVLVTGHASVETAIEALRIGAADYLVKPPNLERLQSLLAAVRARSDGASLLIAAPVEDAQGFGRLIGTSPVMNTLYTQLRRVSPTEATVLLVGESGTGKELAAETLHALSRRAAAPFLAVNCGAISPLLIESELFGHEKGSFTGADRQHRGYFERASGGTLFLDEITEMPVDLQVKLLRVLETRRFMRIGTQSEIDTNVRLIAATNRNPEAAVADGKLRADLYHRLNVFPLQMPPLRERSGDIELLAERFLQGLNAGQTVPKRFAPGVLDRLARQEWRGNVRELRNAVQRGFILADEVIDAEALSEISLPTGSEPGSVIEVAIGSSLADADKLLILATLKQCAGVRKSSAELLGISLKTLYNRLEEYGLQDLATRDGAEAA